jgi:hypothetical protein
MDDSTMTSRLSEGVKFSAGKEKQNDLAALPWHSGPVSKSSFFISKFTEDWWREFPATIFTLIIFILMWPSTFLFSS